MAISNTRGQLLKVDYTEHGKVALSQAAANAAVAPYTVAALITLINAAIAGEHVITVDSIGKATSVQN